MAHAPVRVVGRQKAGGTKQGAGRTLVIDPVGIGIEAGVLVEELIGRLVDLGHSDKRVLSGRAALRQTGCEPGARGRRAGSGRRRGHGVQGRSTADDG